MRRQWQVSKWLFALTTATVFLLFAFGQTASASNPTTISFQGKVVNANGTNVTDGTYSFLFKLYTVSTGGTAVWSETQSTVTVTSGVFQVNLGSVCSFFTAATCNNNTPVDFNANPALYLGITFNSDPAGEMTPRVQLQSVPYAYNADKVGGLSVSQLVQLSPAAQQTGFINVSGTGTFGGGVTATGTVQGATVTATGALQGNSLSVNSGAFAVSSAGAITASTGLTDTGTATVQNATYTTNMVLVNDGQTSAPPAFPNSYEPALTVVTSEVSGSRPLFFGYNAGTSYGAFLDSGACGAFTQMCLDLGNGSASYTALENIGTTLEVGGGDDGKFTDLGLLASSGVGVGTAAPSSLFSVGASSQFQVNTTGAIIASTGITNSGLYNGNTFTNAALGFSGASANTISGTSNQSLTIQSQGTGQLLLNSGSATLGLGATTSTIQRIATGTTTIDLDDTGTTTLQLENSGSGVANLNLYGGSLETGTTPVIRLTNAGALTNITTIGASGLETLSGTGATELAVTGAPVATATVSLVQLGGAIAAGNVATSGGTYLGINEPATGAGSAADFVNFESNGVSQFDVASDGNLVSGGSITGATDSDIKAAETAAATYPETGGQVGYYLSANSTTTNAAFTTTYNITGEPAIDGTFAAITGVAIKGATTVARQHTVVIEINGTTIATIATANQIATSTTTRSFMVMRLDAVWQVIGEGPTATPATTTSTVNTADYAEWIDYSGDTAPQPGDVLSVAKNGSIATVQDSQVAYDSTVLGVVSTSPYDVAGADDGHSVVIALTGRVPVKVNLQNGPIEPGDPLTASSIPGQAMKATSPGRIIGTALTGYDGSQTTTQVMVQLAVGYDDPAIASAQGTILSSQLTANGGLSIDAGSSSNVAIDTTKAGTLNLGSTNATALSLSRSGQTTTVAGGLQVNQAAGFTGGASMTFSGSQNLTITSDLNSTTASAINIVTTPSKTAGSHMGVSIAQADSTNTSGLSSGLAIDNANKTLPIGSAIAMTNSGGGGYTNLITSPNFTVSGAGEVTATGLHINLGLGGSFAIVNSDGAQVASIDSTGGATYSGALNAASASLSGGLNVGGDSNFAGLTTFQKLATFLGKTIFKQDTEFDGHITVASDTAGYASLRKGENSVHISFATPYTTPPVITATITNGQFSLLSVNNVTDQGFDISLQTPATSATVFSWTALAVTNPQTAVNPLPSTEAQPGLTSTAN